MRSRCRAAAQEESAPPGDRDPIYEQPQTAGALRITGAPPAVGDVVLEDSLTARGVLSAGRCSTGRGLAEFVDEGYILKVTGKCREADGSPSIFPPGIPGLTVPDGEVRLEVKAVSGHDRVSFLFGIRQQPTLTDSYQVAVAPGMGVAVLTRTESGQQPVILARRSDLAGRLVRDDWNSVAVRLQGQNLWVLLNDELILSAADPAYERGSVYVGLRRLGNPDDEPESAVVIRNLRVSRLVTG